MHYCLQKLHWSPHELQEYLEATPQMQAFITASILVAGEEREKKQRELEQKLKTK